VAGNTVFADLPGVWRLWALDQYLPLSFAHRGRRLVFDRGIVLLAVVSGLLLVIFRGITDRLIPLFAVGAFLAFTLSQLGMVLHWQRHPRQPGARRSQLINAVGAAATGTTLVIIVLAKFRAGAWISLLLICALVSGFLLFRRRAAQLAAVRAIDGPLHLPPPPVIVVPIRRLDEVSRASLELAVRLSSDVRAVQVRTE